AFLSLLEFMGPERFVEFVANKDMLLALADEILPEIRRLAGSCSTRDWKKISKFLARRGVAANTPGAAWLGVQNSIELFYRPLDGQSGYQEAKTELWSLAETAATRDMAHYRGLLEEFFGDGDFQH